MIFKRMREQILDKAIRGQLVPQLQEEGIVEQIGDAPSEVPFDIPSSWKWVYLKTIVCPTQQKVPDKDFTYIDVSCIASFLVDQPKLLSADKAPSRARKIVHPGMILYATVRPYLKNICIAPEIQGDVIASTAFATFECKKSISNRYLFYVLISDYMSSYAKSVQKGISYPAINDNDFYKTLIPLPPLAEQKRIAAKIESLFSEINRAEKAYEELQSLANVLRGQILQKAIQGKLVPQQPEDGVVEQIGHAPEEMPFELPASWKWASLNSIGTIVSGATPKTSVAEFWNGDINWVTPADLGKSSSKWISHGSRFLTKAGLKSCSAVLMPKGSIVYSSRAPIGHIAIAANELCTNQGCKSFVPKKEYILTEWAYYILIARTKDIQSRASGTTFKEISGTGMGNTLIPLPPLAEQKRIVAKIEALFEQIDLMTK